jgi:hypothetical protein
VDLVDPLYTDPLVDWLSALFTGYSNKYALFLVLFEGGIKK